MNAKKEVLADVAHRVAREPAGVYRLNGLAGFTPSTSQSGAPDLSSGGHSKIGLGAGAHVEKPPRHGCVAHCGVKFAKSKTPRAWKFPMEQR